VKNKEINDATKVYVISLKFLYMFYMIGRCENYEENKGCLKKNS